MTTTALPAAPPVVRARPAGFLSDMRTVATRALRAVPREPESIIPALIVPVFFYVVRRLSGQGTPPASPPGQ